MIAKRIKKKYLIVMTVILVTSVGLLLISIKNDSVQPLDHEEQDLTSTSQETSQSTEAIQFNWVDKTYNLGVREGMGNDVVTQLSLQIPSNWYMKATLNVEEINYTVNDKPITKKVDCYTFDINDPLGQVNLTIDEICNGWASSYKSYSPEMTVISSTTRNSNSGPSNYYRIRIAKSATDYEYVDALLSKDDSLETLPRDSKQVNDAIMIGYLPPNENLHDFYFTVVNANLSLREWVSPDMLAAADKIIVSLHLSPGIGESVSLKGKTVLKLLNPDNESFSNIAIKVPETWKLNPPSQLVKTIGEKLFRIGFQITEVDYMKLDYGTDPIVIKTISNDEGKIFYVIKSRRYIVLSACLPEYTLCSLSLDGKYFFVLMNEYQMYDQYVRELDFSNPATDQAISEFVDMIQSLSF